MFKRVCCDNGDNSKRLIWQAGAINSDIWHLIPRLHDQAIIKQTSSKCIQNTCANCLMSARCLLNVCSMFAWCLLYVGYALCMLAICSMFARWLLDRVNGVLDTPNPPLFSRSVPCRLLQSCVFCRLVLYAQSLVFISRDLVVVFVVCGISQEKDHDSYRSLTCCGAEGKNQTSEEGEHDLSIYLFAKLIHLGQ